MAKKVTDKDTKQTTKATNENIMNSDQMKEHLDNLVDMAKKNDNTLIDTEIVNYFVGKPDIELNTDMMTKSSIISMNTMSLFCQRQRRTMRS